MNIVPGFNVFEQVFKVIDFQVVVVSTLKQYLSSANVQGLLDFFSNGLKGKDIGVLIRFLSIKSAE